MQHLRNKTPLTLFTKRAGEEEGKEEKGVGGLFWAAHRRQPVAMASAVAGVAGPMGGRQLVA